ncbi:nitroreductase family protein [Candidatus Bathyarchaeota archaeon]|nr:nitroreductase family protein [Candidatus Bathyarchaeota archaeon]
MELLEAIKGRRSIRAFKPQDIPDETVEQLIDVASYAPSAGNTQPWAFVIAKKVETKKKLASAAYNQAFVEKAPVVIVVCADENRCSIRYGRRGKTLYCVQDTAAATQNILLTAYSLGLGTCWVGAFNEEEAKKALKTPDGIRPVVMIPVGYPDKKPSQRSRRPLKQIVYHEDF